MKSSIKGHEQVKNFFQQILKEEIPCPSAMLLQGPGGIGKTTLFHEFTLNFYCNKDKEGYCGACHTCRLISHKNFPDIYYFSREETIKIQEVRNLKDYFVTPPVESRIKFVFIPTLENMTISASNSFLKMLEEPPSYLKIVATSNHPGRILPTVRSRLMQIPMTALTWNAFQDFCLEKLPELEPVHHRLFFYLSHSSPGTALQISQNNAIIKLRDLSLEGLQNYFTTDDMSLLYRALDQSLKLQVDRYFFPLLLILLRDMRYARMDLKELIVNRDIYDKIQCSGMEEGMAFIWELADAFSENLSKKKKFYDQFLWNEFYLWKIMKLKAQR